MCNSVILGKCIELYNCHHDLVLECFGNSSKIHCVIYHISQVLEILHEPYSLLVYPIPLTTGENPNNYNHSGPRGIITSSGISIAIVTQVSISRILSLEVCFLGPFPEPAVVDQVLQKQT